jgi:hypothetical protein
MNPKSFQQFNDNFTQDSIIELNRLWISDELGKNAETILISKSFSIIKRKMPHVKLIQSFADGRLGVGTIYKAASFNYYGYNLSRFFQDIETGEFFHKVPFENTNRLQTMLSRNLRYLDKKLKPFNVKTYRYIYLLDRKTKIKLKQLPYPDYEKGMIEINYKHPIGLLCRLNLLYTSFNNLEYANKAMDELKERYSQEQIDKELEKQKLNLTIKFYDDHQKQRHNIFKDEEENECEEQLIT